MAVLKREFPFIFAKDSAQSISAGKFNHCSSICRIADKTVMAWYAGDGECKDDQSVYVVFPKAPDNKLRIGDKTGNPVLWRTSDDSAMLLYSKFEDTGDITRLADRWKWCSLWLQELRITDRIELCGEPNLAANSKANLLARCNPIDHKGRTLIPLYNELLRCGVIAEYDGKLTFLGSVGYNMIQPTIWSTGNIICSLSRNFGNMESHALYCESSDAVNWSLPTKTNIENMNNSLHVAKCWNNELIVWNKSQSYKRTNLCLGKLTHNGHTCNVHRYHRLSAEHGAYPSIVFDDNVYVSYTKFGVIKYHEFCKEDLSKIAN